MIHLSEIKVVGDNLGMTITDVIGEMEQKINGSEATRIFGVINNIEWPLFINGVKFPFNGKLFNSLCNKFSDYKEINKMLLKYAEKHEQDYISGLNEGNIVNINNHLK